MSDGSHTREDELLLKVSDLRVAYRAGEGVVQAVDGICLQVRPGEIVAVVGESGSGKSATALSLMGLTREAGARLGGSVRFAGVEMLSAPARQLRQLRGGEIAIVFQDPLSSLNPVYRVGWQIAEQVRAHDREISRADALAQALDALRRAGMSEPERRMRAYPHELSGGQRQRAMIAMALSCNPRLLIADEPTSALDVTVQAQILDELARLREREGMAIVLVTHDLAVAAGIADRVLVMHGGRIVEQGPAEQIFESPRHAHTRALIDAIIGIDDERPERSRVLAADVAASIAHRSIDGPACAPQAGQGVADSPAAPLGTLHRAIDGSTPAPVPVADAPDAAPSPGALTTLTAPAPPRPLLRLQDLRVEYAPGSRALDGATVALMEGETLGIVGESGCGKTTLLRCAAGLQRLAAGRVLFDGQDITGAGRRTLAPVRARMQVVFQDPDASLNPRKRVEQILAVPLRLRGVPRRERPQEVASLLAEVGLDPAAHADRYPHELSGGQRQRVGIARALALQPQVLLLDEPVSSLDATVRAQIVALLEEVRRSRGLSCLFVAHDIALVRHVCDRIAVMDAGRIVESGEAEAICESPSHPVTRALIAAVPRVASRACPR